MIGYLRGKLLELEPSRALVDVGGVGYQVQIPLSTFYELQKQAEGSEVALRIFTQVREDTLALFGFSTRREKALFEKLLAVSGIGPKLAQAVLSGMPPGDLASALATGDVRRLNSIPGVGKKTAERMVLELKDKVQDLAADLPAKLSSGDGDLVEALVNLGYRRRNAESAVSLTTREHTGKPFADLLRLSLQRLSKI